MADREYALVNYLVERKDDRAMLAALRRGLGQSPGTVADMYPYVTPFLGLNPTLKSEETAYQLAALFGLHPEIAGQGNMGDHLHELAKQQGDSTATDRRFTQLLRMRRDNMDARLRQHVQLLKSGGVPINWHQLYYDLMSWDHNQHFVQKKWAAGYWRD